MSHSALLASTEVLSRQSKMAWIICLSSGLFFFYEFFQLNIFDAINSALLVDFSLNSSQISWMSSSFLWANIIFLLPAGILLDRFSIRKVILLMMSVCVLGTLGFALTSSFMWACIFHFLTGIGNAFCFLAAVVLVSHWFVPNKRALVIGLIVTMAFIGGMMAHAPLVYLVKNYGWRNSLLIDVALGVVLLICMAIFVKDKQESSKITNKSSLVPGFLKVLFNRQTWLAGIYTCCLNLPILVLCALWGLSYLQTVHFIPKMAASMIVSFIFIGSIIGCPLVGWLSDRLGKRKPIMLLGAIATLVAFIPLFLDIPLSNAELSGLFFLIGLFSSSQVISYPLIAESNFAQHTGSATAIASIIIMGGGGIGQILFGTLMQARHQGILPSSYSISDFQHAMMIFPIAAVISILAVVCMYETECKSR